MNFSNDFHNNSVYVVVNKNNYSFDERHMLDTYHSFKIVSVYKERPVSVLDNQEIIGPVPFYNNEFNLKHNSPIIPMINNIDNNQNKNNPDLEKPPRHEKYNSISNLNVTKINDDDKSDVSIYGVGL